MDVTRAVIVLARAPSAPGKTRLTSGLPDHEARALREALFLDTVAVARALDVPMTVAYTPDDGRDDVARLLGDRLTRERVDSSGINLRPQRGDDLGARMQHAIAESFEGGARHVVVIGSDLPTLPAAYLTDAFVALESGIDCVFGSSVDGGYYLMGLRAGADYSSLFTAIAWGTDRVLAETLSAAAVAGLTTSLVDAWFDVDVREDLRRVVGDPRVAEERRDFYRRFLT